MACKFKNCDRMVRTNGYCNSHNMQLWRGKELTPLRRTDDRKLSIKERIHNNTTKDKETKCWNWNLCLGSDGYGAFSYNGKTLKAHRVSYMEFVGPIPDGSVVHHRCANRSCVNPKHLQLTTHDNNLAEMFERKEYIKRIKELEERLAEYEYKEVSEVDTNSGV